MRLRAVRALLLATILLAGHATASAEDSAPEWPNADERLDTLKREATAAANRLALDRTRLELLRRFEGDVRTWQRTIDRETRRGLQERAPGLAGMVIGLGAIVIGAVAWKIAANRSVKDPYRRRSCCIRVGDRVSLQGPFGYVPGEVIEIGLVRLRLRELTDGLEPTGRTVVFPNSVVFTGSFFKHPPAQAKAA